AQAVGGDAVVWVENETLGMVACTTASAAPSSEQLEATVKALRARAEGQLDEVLRASGVQLTPRQFMLLTPLAGALACGGHDSQITFRAMAVDQRSGKYWTTEMTVVGASTLIDDATLNRLAGDLARQFGAVVVAQAAR
ncbi:MAG TPA: hypothetical protein VHQ87_02555, partial [Rhizobacter sp.]|nr:hypothetical protein [Rhizobacter sp.]